MSNERGMAPPDRLLRPETLRALDKLRLALQVDRDHARHMWAISEDRTPLYRTHWELLADRADGILDDLELIEVHHRDTAEHGFESLDG